MKYMKRKLLILVACLVLLSGCSLPGLGGGNSNSDVKITALATSESQIISHIVRLLIEHDTKGKIKPTLINNLGSSTIQHNALMNGDANISGARYTGTELTGPLQEDSIKNPDKAMKATQQGFQKQFDQTFFDSYGFDNTYAFMVTKETAKKYNIETVSDLKKHSDELRLGVDSSWLKRKGDGYPAFSKEYGIEFNTIRPMQIGLVYDALDSKRLDVAVGYSTDGRVAAYDLKVLKDDRRFFPPYDASSVVKNDTLKKYPELKPIMKKLEGKISTTTMQELNYKADGQGQEPAVVAEEFLKAHNYFENDKKGGQ